MSEYIFINLYNYIFDNPLYGKDSKRRVLGFEPGRSTAPREFILKKNFGEYLLSKQNPSLKLFITFITPFFNNVLIQYGIFTSPNFFSFQYFLRYIF